MSMTKVSGYTAHRPVQIIANNSLARPVNGDGINDTVRHAAASHTPLPAIQVGRMGSIINTKA